MKISFIIGDYQNGGGTERVASQIANGLVDKGYEVSIVSLGKGVNPTFHTDTKVQLYELDMKQESPYADYKSRSSRIRNVQSKIWTLKHLWSISKRLYIQLSAIKPDVVVAVDIACYAHIEYCRRKLRFKAIGWEHFCLESRRFWLLDWSRNLAIKHASKVIVLSDKDLEAYQKKYPKANNVMRIYNPMAFSPSSNLDTSAKVVIAAGRFTSQKGFDLLVEAWSKICKDVPEWELRIFGEGEQQQFLCEQIGRYGIKNIKLCGFTKQLDIEMRRASIYALSSRYEGFGLVLVEAQACRLPVVAFDCKHGPAEIVDDGVNGFLVAPFDTNEFANKLLVLMKDADLRKSFSDRSQKDLHRFGVDNVVSQWIDLLDTI